MDVLLSFYATLNVSPNLIQGLMQFWMTLLQIANKINLTSRPIGVFNYLNYVVSTRVYQKMGIASIEFLINDCAHVASRMSDLTFLSVFASILPFFLVNILA